MKHKCPVFHGFLPTLLSRVSVTGVRQQSALNGLVKHTTLRAEWRCPCWRLIETRGKEDWLNLSPWFSSFLSPVWRTSLCLFPPSFFLLMPEVKTSRQRLPACPSDSILSHSWYYYALLKNLALCFCWFLNRSFLFVEYHKHIKPQYKE